MSTAALQMNRVTLRFRDVKAEERFAREQAQKSVRPIRIVAIAMGAINVAAILAVIFFAPEVVGREMTLWKGLAISVALVVAIYGVTLSEFFLRWHQWVMFVIAGTASAFVIHGSYSAPPEVFATRGYVVLLVTIFVIYSVFRLRFPLATAAGVLSMCVFVAAAVAKGLLASHDAFRHAAVLVVANAWGMVICYQMEVATRREFVAMRELVEERARSQSLLLNILPAELAQELSASGTARPARYDSATILFTDFSGFTQAASAMPAERMVSELNEIFAAFDDICDEEGVEKIKTIGDAYMAAAGLPKPCTDHAQRCVRAGLRMVDYLRERNRTAPFKWSLRVGVHSGPVVTGVVGKRKYAFDVWGDTVNIASRMESAGEAGRANVSAYTFDLIRSEFDCEYRGKVDAKGKGQIDMYFVTGTREV